MNQPSGWDGSGSRIRAWFDAAAEASPEEQAKIVAEARRADPIAAEELESLLLHLNRSGVINATPLSVAALLSGGDDAETEQAPRTVGPFRILREIGRGGMGVVYEAEQTFPKRKVALKVVRPELVRTSLLRRFAREAGALALVQHEGIAQLYEAGFADSARRRPYIAMELVEGVTISAFVAVHPDPQSTLSLVASVCDAVDHAHRRGVIHRDLKPGNILVTPEGRAKVLDFGVARLTGADEPEHTATAAGHFIGTIGYMSPEQLSGDPRQVDHRSDVYALGVILYELLAGRPPIDFSQMGLTQAAIAVREQDPVLLGKLNPALRGDIEAIVGKALEKSTAARYSSAAELATELRRHLANEPVLARPQTTWYQARKFARRHKGLVAGVAAAMLALLLGAAGTTWQAIKATNQRNATEEQSLRARETAALLTRMVKSATPEQAMGREPTVKEMLDNAAGDLAADTTIHPIVAGDTHMVLAEAFGSLGDYAKSKRHAQLSADLRTESLGPAHPDTILALSYLARILAMEEKFPEAIALSRQIWETVQVLPPDNYARLRAESVYGQVLVESDKPDFATGIPLLKDVYDRFVAQRGEDDIVSLSAGQGVGIAYNRAGRTDEAVAMLRKVLEGRTRRLGPDHPETLRSIDNLNIAHKHDELDSIQVVQRDLVERATRILGAAHPSTLAYRYNLCLMLFTAHRYKEAAAESQLGVDVTQVRADSPSREGLQFRGLYATAVTQMKDFPAAEIAVRDFIDLCLKTYGPSSDEHLQSITLEYDLAEGLGDFPRMRAAVERLKGSKYEEPVKDQLRIQEEQLRNKAAAPAPEVKKID